MRIAFVGKGGSGKTSISSAFATYLAQKQKVLFVDADVNAHAHECFGINSAQPLGEEFEKISEYLAKNRTDVTPEQMIGSTPPTEKSTLIKDFTNDNLISSLSNTKGNISLLTVGTYTHEDCGVNCYHSKLIPLEMILHHMCESDSETVIMDATAGVDILGTSLYMAFDVFFFMIEPTKKSISVLKTFIEQTNAKVIPILNKVKSEQDIEFVKEQGINVNIILPESNDLRLFEQGDTQAFTSFVDKEEKMFQEILNIAKDAKRDKETYYKNLIEIYKKSCETWYDIYHKTNLFEKTDKSLKFLSERGIELTCKA